MRKLTLLTLLTITCLSFVRCNSDVKSVFSSEDAKKEEMEKERKVAFDRLKIKADSAKAFSKEKGFSTDYCVLIDFSIHSGKNRFFVWDYKNDTIKYSSLCCHGYGKKSTQSKPVFSNTEGSYCSSLGRYKLGARAYSQWGINVHYKMHGLDKTNDNAFQRIVVLHSFDRVPNEEIYPSHLPLGYSQGCPVISDEVMRKMDALLKETKKPVLMWIYT